MATLKRSKNFKFVDLGLADIEQVYRITFTCPVSELDRVRDEIMGYGMIIKEEIEVEETKLKTGLVSR